MGSTPWTTPVPVSPTTPSTPSLVVPASSTVSLTSTARPSPLTVLLVCTVASCLRRRYRCLPWSLLRHVRLLQAPPPQEPRDQLLRLFRSWLVRHHRCRYRCLPS